MRPWSTRYGPTQNRATGIVARAHVSDTKRETLARDLDKPTGIAADGTAVYWTEPSLGRIRKLKL